MSPLSIALFSIQFYPLATASAGAGTPFVPKYYGHELPPRTPGIFLGKDKSTYGKEVGWIDYDPDGECVGGVHRSSDPDGSFGVCPHRIPDDPVWEDEHGDGAGGVNGTGVGADRKAPLDYDRKGQRKRLVHAVLPSYRDPLCPATLRHMFEKAAHPERIRVTVLQQNYPTGDVPCLETYCDDMKKLGHKKCPYKDQIYLHAIPASEASGPTYARGLLSADLYKNYKEKKLHPQDFCLSTDSHMDFEPHWDAQIIQTWFLAKNEYAVLSTYVDAVESLGKDKPTKPHEVPLLCMVTFTNSVRVTATKCFRNLPRPKLTPIFGAGLAFSKCHAELKVPVDPHTPGIFDGEEFNRAARYFTHGYDIYAPHRVYVLHNYHDSQSNPKAHTWHGVGSSESSKRLNTLIDLDTVHAKKLQYSKKDLRLKKSRYGLGDRRSIDQLIEFSGIDLRRSQNSGRNRCGNLEWVPFIEHPKGMNYIPKFDEKEDPLDAYDPTSVWYDGASGGGVAEVAISKAAEAKKKTITDVERNAKVHAGSIGGGLLSPPIRQLPTVVDAKAATSWDRKGSEVLPTRQVKVPGIPMPVQFSAAMMVIVLLLVAVVLPCRHNLDKRVGEGKRKN